MINTANLKKRLVFVAIAVPVAFVIVVTRFDTFDIVEYVLGLAGVGAKAKQPIYFGQLLSLALVTLGAVEYTKMLSAANKKNGFWLGHFWLFTQNLAYLLGYVPPATISNSILLVFVAFEAFIWGRDAASGRWKRASLFFSGMIFLNIAAVGLFNLFTAPVQDLFRTLDIPYIDTLHVVAIVTATFMCDGMAYIVGSAFGKRKLSTTISPNKTLEGSLGGFAASILVMVIFWVFIGNPDYSFFICLIMGAIIGVMAQVGDLTVSLMKRYYHVKDTSDLIPGHGGILDRFDSLFFTAPAIYWFAWIVTK